MVASIFANRYEIVREIARGGMASVYLARDTKLDRAVAVKVLSEELSHDPAFVERFRLEAQAAANLNHPNIVSVYDWGQEQDTSFIVMEFVDGRTLRDLMRADRLVAPGQAADIGAEIAAALGSANRNGVVHRDVKPGNVLITPAGQVKVTDFGIARADGASGGLTRTGAVMGTATYFSPEQAQGLPVDGRSDVYALGVVLFEMLTGVAPYTGDTPVAVAYKHVREPVPRVSERVAGIPPELDRIVFTCMAKDPIDRYQAADDLRADLIRFRSGQAITGAPATAMVASIPDATRTMVATPATAGPTALPPRKQGKGPLIAVIALLVVLIGVVGFLLFTQLGGDSGAESVTVKDVVGQPEGIARTTLEGQGLKVRVVHKPNATVPVGTVARQDPGAGTKVDAGEPVTLTVSQGNTVKVPDVAGATFEDASATLEGIGLQVQRHDEASETVAIGNVVRTDPRAGQRAPKDSPIAVFVSSGPAPITVPNVVGLDQVPATQELATAGFVVQKAQASSSDVPAGIVISTSPPAGTAAPKGSTVRIVVSDGPEQSSVPNVTGQTQSEATTTLTNAGFKVEVNGVPSTPANDGLVIAQSPSAGTSTNAGTTVTITVGSGPPVISTTTTT